MFRYCFYDGSCCQWLPCKNRMMAALAIKWGYKVKATAL